MNPQKAMLSILHLFAGFSFFASAIFFFSLPFLPNVRLKISDALLANPNGAHLIGAGLMIASLVLIGGFYFLSRGHYLRISMGKNAVSIDTALIQKAVEECFRCHFGDQIAISNLYVTRGRKLELEISLAPSEENIREELFLSVEKQLAPLLDEKFGYTKPFDLIVKL